MSFPCPSTFLARTPAGDRAEGRVERLARLLQHRADRRESAWAHVQALSMASTKMRISLAKFCGDNFIDWHSFCNEAQHSGSVPKLKQS